MAAVDHSSFKPPVGLRSHKSATTMDRLAMLEQEGVISKRTDPDHKEKVIYRLTEKSIDLLPILLEFIRWSHKHKFVGQRTWIGFILLINNDLCLRFGIVINSLNFSI